MKPLGSVTGCHILSFGVVVNGHQAVHAYLEIMAASLPPTFGSSFAMQVHSASLVLNILQLTTSIHFPFCVSSWPAYPEHQPIRQSVRT